MFDGCMITLWMCASLTSLYTPHLATLFQGEWSQLSACAQATSRVSLNSQQCNRDTCLHGTQQLTLTNTNYNWGLKLYRTPSISILWWIIHKFFFLCSSSCNSMYLLRQCFPLVSCGEKAPYDRSYDTYILNLIKAVLLSTSTWATWQPFTKFISLNSCKPYSQRTLYCILVLTIMY